MNKEELKDYVYWLEEREKHLEELETMIHNMQRQINDDEVITDINDIKMEIFKVWYYNHFDKKYE